MSLKSTSAKRVIASQLFVTVFCLLFTLTTFSSGPLKDIDPRVAESRAAVKAFGGLLVKELKNALEEGGPVKAIKVCNIEAPQIAESVSDDLDIQIARTSLKTRNPNNNPDNWEQNVLEQFEQRKQNGEAIDSLEYSEETDAGFRYMKAIPTKGLCLTCHGETLSDPVKATLAEYYPNDTATGFNIGDIRGAFTIIKKN
jgi:Protein of unknown function (DUF3365)